LLLLLPLLLPALVAGQGIDFAWEMDASDVPEGYGDEVAAYHALQLISLNRPIRARELAQEILSQDPDSYAAHFVLGTVLHQSEGNLPRALYHLKRSRELFEARYGEQPGRGTPWRWHALVVGELAVVAGSMGRHEEKLRYLALHDELYSPPWPADRGWPLMRLRRYDEARRAAFEGLLTNDPNQQATAYTAMCAIEAEQQRREAAYQACAKAAEHARELGPQGPTTFTNAAEAALGMLRLDEAERLILEGSEHFWYGTVSNPWMDLMLLYLGEGRFPEALEAMRDMFVWRNRQPPFVGVQNRSEIDMAAVTFLLAAGRLEKAAQLTARILDRPDRTGFTSSEEEQMVAAAAVLDSLANRQLATYRREEASWLPFWQAVAARLDAGRRRWRAFLSARRAAAQMAQERMLTATVRPYLAGSVELPEWLEPELVEILGPGLMQEVVKRARRLESLPQAGGYLDVFEAEIALHQGRYRAAIDLAELADQNLPSAELLLRARVAGIGARAALALGAQGRALSFLDRALQLDPAIVRRFELALPARFEAGPEALAQSALRLLRRSPRFTRGDGAYAVRVAATGNDRAQAWLLGPQGSVLAQAQVRARAGENAADLARRLAAELHAQAFAPRVDLTQADIRSLDGAPTAAGGRNAERLRMVLDDLIDN